MSDTMPAYGLWTLVVINSAVFIIFAFSFFKPQTKRDWRSFGAFSAFIVALFTEMYGSRSRSTCSPAGCRAGTPGSPGSRTTLDIFSKCSLAGRPIPISGPFHLLSFAFIGGGFVLIANAWRVLYEAQRQGEMATAGPYGHVRHPQYAGFIMVMFGFLLQWPTLLTLVMFPVLVWMYVRLARSEEREALTEFGDAYRRYMANVPAFLPRFSRLADRPSRDGTQPR